ncbi:IS1595 family transposase [Craterilacuibacter sp.]|uniref:IS1595 family transposase n=1 Tax=Craterilacuibacter sp. TaxID=2870909 RepID=UPI003F2AFC2F
MKAHDFHIWMQMLPQLSEAQRKVVQQTLSNSVATPRIEALLNQRSAEVLYCPHCMARQVQRWGKPGGIQRYRCRGCQKTFNALTGTPAARLKRRDAWLDYARLMTHGETIRASAQAVGIHRTTSFRWRHRFLKLPALENDTELGNIVEADETFFLLSFKGQRHLPRAARHRGGHANQRGLSSEQVPVMVVQDRQGKHFDAMLPKLDQSTVSTLLTQVLAPESLLCTDGSKLYAGFDQTEDIAHEVLNLSKGVRVRNRVLHIQHVNAYDSRLKGWLYHFRGVATKYLANYLGWRRLLEKFGSQIRPETVLLHSLG